MHVNIMSAPTVSPRVADSRSLCSLNDEIIEMTKSTRGYNY